MSLTLSRSAEAYRSACQRVRRDGGSVGLVPTMGALHQGHLALVQAARQRSSHVFVTIFVNPTQFGPTEDLAQYPRDLERDLEACRSQGVAHVFAPAEREMYRADDRTRVRVAGITDQLCGASRPRHFEGVTTIVAKLFALTGECTAVFGRKDYQQLKAIERMSRDLMFPVQIIGHPTVREHDGLALSSRNAYLTTEQRNRARAIPRALSEAVRGFEGGERSVAALSRPVRSALAAAGFRLDYVALADAEEISTLEDDAQAPPRALLAVAAFLGATRLIDNVVLGEDPPPIAAR